MTASLMNDAFAHHVWATEVLLQTCSSLTDEQLASEVPGTYGAILGTLQHLVGSDTWYLSFFRPDALDRFDESTLSIAEMREMMARNGKLWIELLDSHPDPDTDITETEDGEVLHSPVGVRLAQVIHHGTDHRSQVCTALTALGVAPPDFDVWAYARAASREWTTPAAAG